MLIFAVKKNSRCDGWMETAFCSHNQGTTDVMFLLQTYEVLCGFNLSKATLQSLPWLEKNRLCQSVLQRSFILVRDLAF